jgi:DNA-directed RNA polymerase specialized sigma subunit
MKEYTNVRRELLEYVNRICPSDKFKSPRLTNDEEYVFAVKAKSGDMDAWGRLIQANLGLIVNQVSIFETDAKKHGVALSDLAGELLIDAYRRFKDGYIPGESKFTTFVFNSQITIPNMRGFIKKYYSGGLSRDGQKKATFIPLPSDGDSEYDDISPEEWESSRKIAAKQRALPTPADYASLNLDGEDLACLVEAMSPRDKRIIMGHYYNHESQTAIGKELGMTRQGVAHFERLALKKLGLKIMSDLNLEKRLNER